MNYIKYKNKILCGDYFLPGDKSLSHRIVMISAILNGKTRIYNLSKGDDVVRTITAMKNANIKIRKYKNYIDVVGKGLSADFQLKKKEIYLGNSGTSARLLFGLFASYKLQLTFKGDKSLSKRPMKRVTDLLEYMGVRFKFQKNTSLPITLFGTNKIINYDFKQKIASAQIKSAILLAALRGNNIIKIHELNKSRDHTELMLHYFGANITVKENEIVLSGGKELFATGEYKVASDPSSAAFLAVAALLIPGSHVILRNINVNPFRIGIYNILKLMGGHVIFLNQRTEYNEQVADIEVKYSKLKAVLVTADIASSLIDEYPILAIAAANAEGVSRFEGIEELKYKESNRLEVIARELQKCNINVKFGDDWLELVGSKHIKFSEAVKADKDHRIAMAFIVLAQIIKSDVEIDSIECIKTSFPEFFSIF